MARTTDRHTFSRDGKGYEYPMAADKEIFGGSLVVLDASGNAEPGTTATGKIAVGKCAAYKDNTDGSAADVNVRVEPGIHQWVNSTGDPLTKTSIGDTVYVEDDETVCATSSGKSSAGIMVDIDSAGVWVKTEAPVALLTGLLAANNLSDVGTVATARTNLGLGSGDSPTFTDVTTTDDVTVGDDLIVTGLATIGETLAVTGDATFAGGAGAITVVAAGSSLVCLDASPTGFVMGSSGNPNMLQLDTQTGAEKVIVEGTTSEPALHVDVGEAQFDEKIMVGGGIDNAAATTLLVARPGCVHTGGVPATATAEGIDATPVNTEIYYSEIFVPCNMIVTGISHFNGSDVGTDARHAALLDIDGAKVAGSDTGADATSGADTYEKQAFTGGAITVLGPATYFVAVIYAASTGRYNAHGTASTGLGFATNLIAGKITGQSYGAIPGTNTVPMTYTSDLGPIASLY